MRRPSDARLAAVTADLEDYIMSSGTDAQIAAVHDVDAEAVRVLRRRVDARWWLAELRQRGRELAYLTGDRGDIGHVVLEALDAAIDAAKLAKGELGVVGVKD